MNGGCAYCQCSLVTVGTEISCREACKRSKRQRMFKQYVDAVGFIHLATLLNRDFIAVFDERLTKGHFF